MKRRYADRTGRANHEPPFSADITAAIALGLAPVPTSTATASISIPPLDRATVRRRPVAGCLRVWAPGELHRPGTNVGNDAGGNISGSPQKAPPAKKLLRRQGMAARNLAHRRRRLVALRHEPDLVVVRSIPSASGPREDFEPPNRLVVVGLRRKLCNRHVPKPSRTSNVVVQTAIAKVRSGHRLLRSMRFDIERISPSLSKAARASMTATAVTALRSYFFERGRNPVL